VNLLSILRRNAESAPAPSAPAPIGGYQAPPTYDQDGLMTIHNTDFLADPQFQRAYSRGVAADRDYLIQWRVHITTWAASTAMKRPGDFIECGVNRGFQSSAVMSYLNWNETHGNRRFFLMDTFCGLVLDLLSPEEKALGRFEMFKDAYPECYETTKRNFEEFENVVIIRGTVPDTLSQVETSQIAYMHIDMNCAAPEVAALRYFWSRLVDGAFVVLDDYAWVSLRPQKEAMDELGREIGFSIASLPTGQGLIVK
jgi:Macrocin-O-methyltransferase (TylF)